MYVSTYCTYICIYIHLFFSALFLLCGPERNGSAMRGSGPSDLVQVYHNICVYDMMFLTCVLVSPLYMHRMCKSVVHIHINTARFFSVALREMARL